MTFLGFPLETAAFVAEGLVIFGGIALALAIWLSSHLNGSVKTAEALATSEAIAAADAAASTAKAEAAAANERGKALELRIAEQQERAARAEKDLLQLQNWVKQRAIPPEQLKRLIEALRAASPKGAVSVSCIDGDAEGCRFAEQFHRALRAAGWPTPERVTNMVEIMGQGVVLIADPKVPPDHLDPLMEALASVGLPIKVDHDPKFRSVSADPILLAVFSKP